MISSKKFNDKGTMLFALNGDFELLTATKNVEDELENILMKSKKSFMKGIIHMKYMICIVEKNLSRW